MQRSNTPSRTPTTGIPHRRISCASPMAGTPQTRTPTTGRSHRRTPSPIAGTSNQDDESAGTRSPTPPPRPNVAQADVSVEPTSNRKRKTNEEVFSPKEKDSRKETTNMIANLIRAQEKHREAIMAKMDAEAKAEADIRKSESDNMMKMMEMLVRAVRPPAPLAPINPNVYANMSGYHGHQYNFSNAGYHGRSPNDLGTGRHEAPHTLSREGQTPHLQRNYVHTQHPVRNDNRGHELARAGHLPQLQRNNMHTQHPVRNENRGHEASHTLSREGLPNQSENNDMHRPTEHDKNKL